MTEFKLDSFSNYNTKLGFSDRDANENVTISSPKFYTRQVLEYLYTDNWLIQRACTLLPDLAWIKGGEVITKDETKKDSYNEIIEDLYAPWNLDVENAFKQAQIMANIHRAAVLLIDNGDKNLSKPLTFYNRVRPVKELRIYDGWDCVPYNLSSYSGRVEPEFYQLGGKGYLRATDRGLNLVHKSRILPFYAYNSYLTPYMGDYLSNGWRSDTLIRKILQPVIRYSNTLASVGHAMQSFEVTHLEVQELLERLFDTEFKDYLCKRATELAKGYSLFRVLITDKDRESVSQISRNFSGLDKIIAEIRKDTAASLGIPSSILYNQYGSDFGQLTEAEQVAVANLIASVRKQCFTRNIYKLNHYLFSNKYYFDTYPKGWRWQWKSYMEEDEESKANTRQKEIDSVIKLIEKGVLTPKEVRNSLFSETGYKGLDYVRLEEAVTEAKASENTEVEEDETA